MYEFAGEPTLRVDEVIIAMSKLKNEKESGGTAEAIKHLPPEGIATLHRVIVKAYNCEEYPDEWRVAIFKCLHKNGDTTNPNNGRGICLKDMPGRES
mmetsp:Transcript_24091/g.35515  ORF Transcript_24091/g.35515 Transcript_24091/m.35515 type:complete len:97 (-) Transcript_24091:825-1115(-)